MGGSELTTGSYKSECVEESYVYCLDNVEYRLSRTLCLPDTTPDGTPRGALPPLPELQPPPFWVLQLKVLLQEANPELANLAVDLLASAKRSLGTCFDFQQLDRRAFDPRVQVTPARNAMPQPLGSVVPVARP